MITRTLAGWSGFKNPSNARAREDSQDAKTWNHKHEETPATGPQPKRPKPDALRATMEKHERIVQEPQSAAQRLQLSEDRRQGGHRATVRPRQVVEHLADSVRESAETVLQLELQRLDAALRAIYARAMAGEYPAIDRLLRISERRAKLLGIEASGKRASVTPGPIEAQQTREELVSNLSEYMQRLADAQKANREAGRS